jgi:hypothetical protein
MFDVVIPARNEEATVGPIVVTWKRHRRIGRVIVAIDAETIDDTATLARIAGAHVIEHLTAVGGMTGKGQTVRAGLCDVTTRDVIFCDADYRNLSSWHVSRMCAYPRLGIQLIGQPDIPENYPKSKVWAWPWVSGIRRVPAEIARSVNLHGYLMEVQLNNACKRAGVPTMITRLRGLTSPYEMTAQRKIERDRDFRWGQEHGVLPRGKDQIR